MISILQLVIEIISAFLLYKISAVLSIIARDTLAREELSDTIMKFAKMAGGVELAKRKGRKVVTFEAKDDDEETKD